MNNEQKSLFLILLTVVSLWLGIAGCTNRVYGVHVYVSEKLSRPG